MITNYVQNNWLFIGAEQIKKLNILNYNYENN